MCDGRRWFGSCWLGDGSRCDWSTGGSWGWFFAEEVGQRGEGKDGAGDENDGEDGGAEELAGGDHAEHFLGAFALQLAQKFLQLLDGGAGVCFQLAEIGLGAGHGRAGLCGGL